MKSVNRRRQEQQSGRRDSGEEEPISVGRHVLPTDFFARPAEIVARDLLGAHLISEIGGKTVVARIVETEAYIGPEDDASHAAARIGRTKRNASLFGPPGHAYVYRIYGIHWCMNTVTGTKGHPSGVLLRAAEPVAGLAVARARRSGRPDRELMRGPGNLCEALGVTGEHNHHRLSEPPLMVAAGETIPDASVLRGPRIGVTRAADWPLRFWVAGSPSVSARTRGQPYDPKAPRFR